MTTWTRTPGHWSGPSTMQVDWGKAGPGGETGHRVLYGSTGDLRTASGRGRKVSGVWGYVTG